MLPCRFGSQIKWQKSCKFHWQRLFLPKSKSAQVWFLYYRFSRMIDVLHGWLLLNFLLFWDWKVYNVLIYSIVLLHLWNFKLHGYKITNDLKISYGTYNEKIMEYEWLRILLCLSGHVMCHLGFCGQPYKMPTCRIFKGPLGIQFSVQMDLQHRVTLLYGRKPW